MAPIDAMPSAPLRDAAASPGPTQPAPLDTVGRLPQCGGLVGAEDSAIGKRLRPSTQRHAGARGVEELLGDALVPFSRRIRA
ncbi:hypothetical protein BIV57_00210 [Mangrovactinospora gilvigrisea]|uniref:Uncharacterized protein n=1 Tax=Mangrovactinospora gilvigrisea TaxID=1428644 RepID=A0A1J7BKV1_9ACTN|nr:hypothetical protein [Mangrovactinospora gilvigrisea]OIV39311.1 hypothetical protein BIV57_00210 [Mangrovactinospora gilvigrisea]